MISHLRVVRVAVSNLLTFKYVENSASPTCISCHTEGSGKINVIFPSAEGSYVVAIGGQVLAGVCLNTSRCALIDSFPSFQEHIVPESVIGQFKHQMTRMLGRDSVLYYS